MASQRITIAKLAGVSGEFAYQRLLAWNSLRDTVNPNLWSPEQWPNNIRQEADDFAERLRGHGHILPVCHFVEWADMWSMGDLIPRWLTPPNCTRPIGVHANRHEIFAYRLPDVGRLAAYLVAACPQQWPETDWFITRLREAVSAWDTLAPSATLIVLRHAVSSSVLDEEVAASLTCRPDWLS
jgi:hypothetical protein